MLQRKYINRINHINEILVNFTISKSIKTSFYWIIEFCRSVLILAKHSMYERFSVPHQHPKKIFLNLIGSTYLFLNLLFDLSRKFSPFSSRHILKMQIVLFIKTEEVNLFPGNWLPLIIRCIFMFLYFMHFSYSLKRGIKYWMNEKIKKWMHAK